MAATLGAARRARRPLRGEQAIALRVGGRVIARIHIGEVSPRLCRGTHQGLTYTTVIENLSSRPRGGDSR